MSISAITSSNVNFQQNAQSSSVGIAAYLQQLSAALQSGNLTSAQQAYTALQTNLQNSQGSGTSSEPYGGQSNSLRSTLQQGLTQIGKDLQSGNVAGAQTAFTNLQQQIQTVVQAQGAQPGGHFHGHHHHGGGDGGQAATAAGSTSSTSASSTTTGINLTA